MTEGTAGRADSDSDASAPDGREGTSRLGRYLDEGDADAAARRLLEGGVTPVVESETDPISQREVWWVAVFAHDLVRGSELLGVPLPPAASDDRPPARGESPLTPAQTRWRPQRKHLWLYVLGYLALLAVVSIGTFVLTVSVLGSDDSEVPPPPTGGPVTTLPGG